MGIVEVDGTYIGGKKKNRDARKKQSGRENPYIFGETIAGW
jgi:hypothetical protein